MRIGIDLRLWSQTGVGRYIRNLVIELDKIDKKNEYVLFALPQNAKNIKSQITNIKYQIVETDIRWHSIPEQIKFNQILNKQNLDLVHFPYFSHPIFYNKPFVVTIHDLIINHFPTGRASTLPPLFYLLKRGGYLKVLDHAVKKSKKIIVPLETVKKDLVETLNVSKDKIVVTPEGFDINIKESKNTKYKIPDTKYFLYVGNAYPHKNLERLIEAMSIINGQMPASQRGESNVKLLLVGKDDFFYKRLEKKKFKNVIFLHNVSDRELYHLYSNAIAAVSPSLMEGFGLLPLEAFGCGTIPVISDIPAFREVCGETAIYFNPKDEKDIADKLDLALKLSPEKRGELIKKGRELLKKFSWRKMAEETLEVYNS